MTTVDLYIYATKRNWFDGAADQETLIAHAGTLTGQDDTHKANRVPLGQAIEALNGKDPVEILERLPILFQALDPAARRATIRTFEQLRFACKHCMWVRNLRRPSMEQRHHDHDGGTTVADLYQNDFRLVIKRDGVLI